MPRLARCSAIEVPTMPAPNTIASVRAISPDLQTQPFIWNGSGAFAMTCCYLPETGSYANSDGVDRRAGLARPARYARAGRLGILRPRRAPTRRLREAFS